MFPRRGNLRRSRTWEGGVGTSDSRRYMTSNGDSGTKASLGDPHWTSTLHVFFCRDQEVNVIGIQKSLKGFANGEGRLKVAGDTLDVIDGLDSILVNTVHQQRRGLLPEPDGGLQSTNEGTI